MVSEGVVCEECGMHIGPACGHPRTCEECDAEEEYYRENEQGIER